MFRNIVKCKRWRRRQAFAFACAVYLCILVLQVVNFPGATLFPYETPDVRRAFNEATDNSDTLGSAANATIRENQRKVMMCAIVVNEEAYIDEWVDYHHALGFDTFHMYDNSEGFEMEQWAEEKGDHVRVTHIPGLKMQMTAYQKCAKKSLEEGYVWAAFFDVDEFLQLKKHENVVEFLEEHASSGSISVNWLLFQPARKELLYKPLPVTKRFMYRKHEKNEYANQHIKIIAKLSDLEGGFPSPHFADLKHGTQHDTNNHTFTGPFNDNGPTDVAALYHYHKKSHKEYTAKRLRGRADVGIPNNLLTALKEYIAKIRGIPNDMVREAQDLFTAALNKDDNSFERIENMVYDDSAWESMKKYVPSYAMYDGLESKKKEEKE